MQYRQLSPVKLNTGAAYQRRMNMGEVRAIEKNFDLEAFGVFLVGRRKDGSYWIVDGQKRNEVAKRKGMKKVACLVFESDGKEHEARVYRLVNTQQNMSLKDKISALLEEGDATTCDMQQVVERSGFRLSLKGQTAWPYIRPLSSVQKTYSRGNLSEVLCIIKQAWIDEQDALQVPVIDGLSLFLQRYGKVLDKERLVAILMRYKPTRLKAECDVLKMQGGSRGAAFREVLVSVYNKRLRGTSKLKG